MINHFRRNRRNLPRSLPLAQILQGGMTRLLYSLGNGLKHNSNSKRMDASGLETRFDEVGNLYGRLRGAKSRNR